MDETCCYLVDTRTPLDTCLQLQWNADQEHWHWHQMYSKNLKLKTFNEHQHQLFTLHLPSSVQLLFLELYPLCLGKSSYLQCLKLWYWPTSLTSASDIITTSRLTVKPTRTLRALTLIGQTCSVTNSAHRTGLCIISSSFGTVKSCRTWVRQDSFDTLVSRGADITGRRT